MAKAKAKNQWEELLYDSSAKCIDNAVDYILANPGIIDSLFVFAVEGGNNSVSRRAARTISKLIELKPNEYHDKLYILLDIIENIEDESKCFQFLRPFTIINLPGDEEFIGKLFGVALSWVERRVERIAIKLYAAEILYRISEIEPELKRELLLIYKQYTKDEKISFRNKCKYYIAKIEGKKYICDKSKPINDDL